MSDHDKNLTLFDPPDSRKAGVILNQLERNVGKSFDQPLSHRNDSSGSFEAADRQIKSGRLSMRLRVTLDLVKSHSGFTSMELSAISGLDRYRLARALPILASRGLIRRGRERLCSKCHVRCLTWWIIK